MTIRFLFDRLWQIQNSRCGKQSYARNNPFFLTSSDVQKGLAATRHVGENNNSICFASREEGRRQTFLFFQRLKNREGTLSDFCVRIPQERLETIIKDLKPFYKHLKLSKDTLIEALCDE